MTHKRRVLIPLVAVLIVGSVVFGRVTAASSAAAPTTYTLTLAGTDAHPLDSHFVPIYVGDGGVEAVGDPGGVVKFPYLEIGLDLPVGARVTSLAVVYSYCNDPAQAPTFSFGSYSPIASTVPIAILTGSHCGKGAITKTGTPLATVTAGRRYVLDYNPRRSAVYPGNGDGKFYGTVVKYTCTSPCVP